MNRLRFAVPKGLDLLKGSFANVIYGPASSQNDRRQYNYNSPVHLRDPPLKIYESFSSLSNILGGIGQFCQVFELSFATFFRIWVPSNAAVGSDRVTHSSLMRDGLRLRLTAPTQQGF